MGIVKRDGIKLTVISYIGSALGYLNKILLFPNILSTEQVGLANIMVSIALLYAQLSSWGIHSVVLRFYPFLKTKDKKNNGFFFWTVFAASTGFVLFTCVFLFFREPIIAYYAPKAHLLTEFYFGLIPLGLATMFYFLFETYLRGLYKNVFSSFFYEIVLRLMIMATIVLYFFHCYDFVTFVWLYIGAHFVPTLALLIYLIYLKEAYFRPVINQWVRRLMPFAVTYGIFSFFNGSVGLIQMYIDQLMLSQMIGLGENGVYSTMIFIVSVMLIPYRSITKIVTTIVSNLWHKKDMVGMQTNYRKLSVAGLILGSYFLLIIWVNMDNVFCLLPPVYATGRYVFLILALGRLFDMYCGINGYILVFSKLFYYDLFFSFLLILSTILNNFWLIPLYGINGAAIATTTSLVLLNIARLLFVHYKFRLMPLAWKDILVLPVAAAVLAISLILPYVSNFIIDAMVRTLLCSAVFAGGVYILKVSPDMNKMLEESLMMAKTFITSGFKRLK